ncbi:hypothetical protein [uncultured Acetatifactor sp.]|jgi:hypothetical protein|uniref:hypothetical protein n=1 Tax=uncultured Acetatifactor sp. TaxID=1671927 RepID=UPI0026217CA5|nr:hypothetical protein [uncultured Acetatifactor sp.]
MPNFCLIITATIKPVNGVYSLTVVDRDIRKRQYIDSLKYAIDYYDIERIIFCENSKSVDKEIYSIKKYAEERNKKLEILSFQGDAQMILQKGKGYGEGEILKYAIDNSKLIEKEDYIIKLTGRLTVSNLDKIIKMATKQEMFINKLSIKGKVADTRLYIVKKDIYEKVFADIYLEIDDKEKKTMEALFYNQILRENLKVSSFGTYPEIIGISGSTGEEYRVAVFKHFIKIILNILGLYKIN